MGCGGAQITPNVAAYNTFAEQTPGELAACALFPVNEDEPFFRNVGHYLCMAVPTWSAGQRFAVIRPGALRLSLVTPFFRVRASRQAECRRGPLHAGSASPMVEQLLLPFSDERNEVRVIISFYEPI